MATGTASPVIVLRDARKSALLRTTLIDHIDIIRTDKVYSFLDQFNMLRCISTAPAPWGRRACRQTCGNCRRIYELTSNQATSSRWRGEWQGLT